MTSHSKITAAQQDQADYASVKNTNLQELLAYCAKKTGRSPIQIGREFAQLAKSDRKINIMEYVRWKLYDADRFSDDQRAEFISNDLHWPMTHACNDKSWMGTAEDKVVAATMLGGGGVPVPQSLAVIDRTSRLFPGLRKISTPQDLCDLVIGEGPDLFGKITAGMVSFGAFRVTGGDATHITCAGHQPMTYDAFLEDFVGSNSYLVQRRMDNHAVLAPYASALATVRMVNMVREDDVYCPIAVIKLPYGDNIADAFWREGNLACEVDVETGRILSVVRRNGPEMDFHPDHPDVPGLMGLTLPHWQDLIEVNALAARIYAPIAYQSTDIAITPDGPVVVELNYGGGFDLPQNASGRGMLTPEVKAFFEGHGYAFGAAQAPKSKTGGLRLFGRK